MDTSNLKKPWAASTGEIPLHVDYYDGSMFSAIKEAADKYPDYIALDFMGKKTTYKEMIEKIYTTAKALKTIGIRKNDTVTIMMPNCPQALFALYALNLVGAVASMVHPLSSEKEIEMFLNISKSITIVTLDQFYGKVEAIRKNTHLVNVILASIKDELTPPVKAGYMVTEGMKQTRIPADAPVIMWKDFLKLSKACFYDYQVERKSEDNAILLYSGGTTGTNKGIMLTNYNFNALGKQIIVTNPMFRPADRMLAAMPIFHGFGLGVSIHAMLMHGGRCVLVPRFNAESFVKLILKYKCNFLAGVPTLYAAMLSIVTDPSVDLSFLKGVYSGGDTLLPDLKKKFDKFLYDHNASIQLREGYGATECVNASCLTPPHMYKEGSIGIPFPDTFFKIVKPNTDEEVPYGEEGEIVIAGPTIMKGYVDNPEETQKTVRLHNDGCRWLHTGDLGVMDSEGFVYFKGRIKRMIVSSGYNIYPANIEHIICDYPAVKACCAIGIPDPYRIHRVKVFLVMNDGYEFTEEVKADLVSYCRKHIAKYAMPHDFEVREDLPKTAVGKVAYRVLEEEEAKKREAAEQQ